MEDNKAKGEKAKALAAALAQIEKQFGKGSVMKFSDADVERDIEVVSTGSLGLDIALGVGGVPRGRIVEIYGPEASGKTTLVYHLIAQAQRLGGQAAFIDAEHAMDPVYAKAIGVDQGEVFTTDTHSVSALILGGRGYHPVGEVISHDRLIHHIREATLAALSDLEYVKVACRIVTVPKVKVIGEERLKAFSLLIDEALKQAKKIAVPIFAVSGLFLMLFLLFV